VYVPRYKLEKNIWMSLTPGHGMDEIFPKMVLNNK
jgi:hypothetical protein